MKLAILVAALFLLAASAEILAQPTGPDDFPISAMDLNGNFGGVDVAYNPIADEYLVAWSGETEGHAGGEREIYVQRIDAETGARLSGDDLRISAAGGFPQASSQANAPTVAYAPPPVHEYLVIWPEIDSTGLQTGLNGRRLDGSSGNPIGDSFVVTTGRDASPDLLFDEILQSYMLAWFRILPEAIVARRLAVDGSPLPDSITTTAPFPVFSPRVAHDPDRGRYEMVWTGEASSGKKQIWGRHLDAETLDPLTGNILLATVGEPGNTDHSALNPALVYRGGEYLLTYTANEADGPADREIYGRRLDSTLGFPIFDEIPITGVSGDDPLVQAHGSAMAVSSHATQLVWAVGVPGVATLGARLNRDVETTTGPFLVGDSAAGELIHRLVVAGSARGHLAVWVGAETDGDGQLHREVFGQLLRGAELFADGFESGDTSAWSSVVQ